MKNLVLSALLSFGFMHAVPVEELLDRAHIEDARQRMYLSYLCHLMEKLSVEDRTIINIFLDSINDEEEASSNDSDMCYECASLKKSE